MGQAANSTSVGYDNFFRFRAGFPSPRGLWFSAKDRDHSSEAFLQLKKGERKLRAPAEFVVHHGISYADFLGNEEGLLIVSERILSILEGQRLRGWRAFPVTLYAKNGSRIKTRYTGLSIIGRAGPMDKRRSVTASRARPDGTMNILGMNGLYFGLKQWDGSDLFMLDDPSVALVLCTKRLVDALRTIKASGWDACPVKDYVFGVQR